MASSSQRGGSDSSSTRVDVTRILLPPQVVAGARSLRADFSPKYFKRDPTAPAFGGLPRLESYRGRAAELAGAPPITLRPYGTKGYYTIVDGRHRLAQMLAARDNLEEGEIYEINATVVEE